MRAAAGIDAIGVGGDYDGVSSMGSHLTDVSTYPLVFAELRDRGYTDAELQRSPGAWRAAGDAKAETVAARLQRAAEVIARHDRRQLDGRLSATIAVERRQL